MEYNEEKNINKFHQSQDENQEMDINNIHKIMHDPYEFYIPNQKHEPFIQKEQYELQPQMENNSYKSITNTNRYDNNCTHDYNKIDKYGMNTIFDNTGEEIIFNNEEIDKDKLEENNINENKIIFNNEEIDKDKLEEKHMDENNLMTEQYDDTNNDKEVQLNHETQEGNESNR